MSSAEQQRIFRNLRESVDVLTGARGDKSGRAVLARELSALGTALGRLTNRTSNVDAIVQRAAQRTLTLGEQLLQISDLIERAMDDIASLEPRVDDADQFAQSASTRSSEAAAQAASALQVANSVANKIAGAGQVPVNDMDSADAVGTAPTKAEFNALRADVIAVRDSLAGVVAALSA